MGKLSDLSFCRALLLTLAGCSLLGFAWGLFFSGRTETSMGAILAAVIGQAATAPAVLALWGLPLWLWPEQAAWFGEV